MAHLLSIFIIDYTEKYSEWEVIKSNKTVLASLNLLDTLKNHKILDFLSILVANLCSEIQAHLLTKILFSI